VPLTVSLISHAANHCLTAQANMSSGPMIVQNIISSRSHNLFQSPEGGTFGWTDTHAQMIIVEMQFQVMLNSVRFVGQLLSIPALAERSIGITWAVRELSRRNRTKYWGNTIVNSWDFELTSFPPFYISCCDSLGRLIPPSCSSLTSPCESHGILLPRSGSFKIFSMSRIAPAWRQQYWILITKTYMKNGFVCLVLGLWCDLKSYCIICIAVVRTRWEKRWRVYGSDPIILPSYHSNWSIWKYGRASGPRGLTRHAAYLVKGRKPFRSHCDPSSTLVDF